MFCYRFISFAALISACFGDQLLGDHRTRSRELATAATNYCGSSWTDAAARCEDICPNGVDSECPNGQQCYGGISTCNGGMTDTTNYCGSSWIDAAAKCDNGCPNGVDSECPNGQQCYGGITSCTDETTNYCGSSWSEAANCNDPCPGGIDAECPDGQQCYGGITTCTVETTNYCGSSWTDATNCENACPGGIDAECPVGQQCYGGITTCIVETTNYCGLTWTDATNCEKACPGGLDAECESGQRCFAGITTCPDPSFSNFPSQTPTSFSVGFNGFHNAYSIQQGIINVSWNPPIVGDYFSMEDVSYDIFVATGEYDFSTTQNIPELIDLFEANADYEHIEVPGNVQKLSINSTNYGELHTLLITAKVAGEYSRNTRGSKVIVSRFSPHIRDELHIIGVFVPTRDIRIDLEAAPVNQEHQLTFSGSGVTEEAKALKIGDYFSGFTSELDSFVRLVTGQVTLENDLVVLRVVDVPLEDLFDRLDLDGVFGISREDGAQDMIRRQLIFGSIIDAFEDVGEAIWDSAKAIGSEIENVAEAIVNFVEFAVTGELEEKFTLVDLRETWKRDINDFVTLSGGVHFKAEFVIQIHIDGLTPDFFRLGIEADYSCNSLLELNAEGDVNESEELELWTGKMRSKIFFLGPVPVEAYYKPRLDLQLEVGASVSASAEIGVKLEGSTEISAIYDKDHSPQFYERLIPPSLNPTYCLEIAAEASLGASATIVLSMDVGIYQGLLNANTGVAVGLVMESGIALEEANISSQFDLMVRFSIPFKADALWESYTIAETDIYQHDWPIISLPSLDISFLEAYTCPCSEMCSLEGDWSSAGSSGPCSGDDFLDRLSEDLSEEFNNNIFLAQSPDPADPPFPSTVYKFQDFVSALKKLQTTKGDQFQLWMGDDCTIASTKAALVNIAAFLGQAMRETIIYDACDENNWDKWHSADIPKDPTSPPEYLPALYPMSSGCGQLGQRYADYDCDDACPIDLSMEITGSTNAGWIGAPPPLFCGPKSKYDGIGYWNPMQNCPNGGICEGEPFHYEGQSAGVYVPADEDANYPEHYYLNPLGDDTPPRDPDSFPPTNVEGCCWWGRGVIQTTGRCNFGKLNKHLGAGSGSSNSDNLYPDINFCQNPQAVCEGPSELKWIAGIFFWVSDPQVYDQDGFRYKEGVQKYVTMGCADNPDQDGCDFLFEYASGIVNRGCHDPGEDGCPGCVPGATCDPAHNIPERVAASKQVLKALMEWASTDENGIM